MSKKKIIVIIGLILFILVAGFLVWYIFNGGSGSSNNDNGSTTVDTKPTTASSKDIATYMAGVNNLSKFNKLINVTGVSDTLKLAGSDYVVLAPTDDAFKELPAGYYDSLLTDAKKDNATDIAKYHYAILSSDLTNGQKLKTAEGQEVIVSIDGGVYYFTDAKGNKATAIKTAQKTSNGTLYVINKVLLPQ